MLLVSDHICHLNSGTQILVSDQAKFVLYYMLSLTIAE